LSRPRRTTETVPAWDSGRVRGAPRRRRPFRDASDSSARGVLGPAGSR
jgi:hypothetical protein